MTWRSVLAGLHRYRKTLVAAAGAVVAWSGIVIDSAPAHITAGEWRSGVILVATAVGVLSVPNRGA